MSTRTSHYCILLAIAFVIVLSATHASASLPIRPPSTPVGRWRDASIDDYRKHLGELVALVESCAKARDLKACDPSLIGPDDRIPLSNDAKAQRRLVRYGWLRVLFSRAEDADESLSSATAKQANSQVDSGAMNPTTSQLLQDARLRLMNDLAQVSRSNAGHPEYTMERRTMQQVLSGPEFRDLEQAGARETVLEKLDNWLNHLFERAARLKAKSAWVGRMIVWGFILAVCSALVLFLLRLERQWRNRMVADIEQPATANGPARDWQLWLDHARRAAAKSEWREAIHCTYWASISRLESGRIWPADRARTPREYLALIRSGDARKLSLARLTHTFERIWYGGQPAGAREYESAMELASTLINGDPAKGADALRSVTGEGS